jgi:hypothetical protein
MKDHVLLFTAMHELKIDVPVMKYEIKDDKVTLYLYGGQVVTWSPKVEQPAAPSKPAAPKSKKKISAKIGVD